MPRKAFLADLQALASGSDIRTISNVCRGDDNEFQFLFSDSGTATKCTVTCMVVPELADYPTSHTYHIYTDDDAPAELANKIVSFQAGIGMTVRELLQSLSKHLEDADGDLGLTDEEIIKESAEEFDEADEDYCDEDFGFDEDVHYDKIVTNIRASVLKQESRRRIQQDLRFARDAGFKVGVHGNSNGTGNFHVSLSVRISKLGISDEAMRAWHVQKDDYLILIISYLGGYQSFQTLLCDIRNARSNITFKVGLSKNYRPTQQELGDILMQKSKISFTKKNSNKDPELVPEEVRTPGWRDSFISRALNELFNQRFLMILRARSTGLTWTGAERYYHEVQGSLSDRDQDDAWRKCASLMDTVSSYPDVVTADHISNSEGQDQLSVPLLAMQFLLRHFVRCTEFCLVCHCPLDHNLQAIKPYVCDKPLCLHQYLSLGFGPSIEHEIQTQPQVVDLLISFCYKTAAAGQLKSLPTGLNLMIPEPETLSFVSRTDLEHENLNLLAGKYFAAKSMIVMDKTCQVRIGEWVVIRSKIKGATDPQAFWLHHRVEQIFDKEIIVSEQGVSERTTADQPTLATCERGIPVHVMRYNCFFDELSHPQKHSALLTLLNLLPTVQEMREYLKSSQTQVLAEWKERIPPAAYTVLRWIIASNRACIMQVEPYERVSGLGNDWIQFRFAMGAPDKEIRFLKSVTEVGQRLQLKYPTLFAWHGSRAHNWHSIIREGLHFNTVVNGRAYGSGVYFSPNFATSFGYCSHQYMSPVTSATDWHKSDLGVACAMSLNEIVNAPDEYQSKTPHYVVAQLDWIQTRYLFVKTTKKQTEVQPIAIVNPIEQDPARTPSGEFNARMILPHSAISRAAQTEKRKGAKEAIRDILEFVSGPSKRVKHSEDEQVDDDVSVATWDEDREYLNYDENEYDENNPEATLRQPLTPKEPETDFVPGSLDHKTLVRFPAPLEASPIATKQLMQRFNALKKVQDEKPPATLGWYLDPQQFAESANFFQWIVELHSLDQDTPLARDMRRSKITSLVLEFRFPDSFPFAPPFVRVIRPRLLPFQSGGGGHVTLGGSLCMQLLTSDGWLPTMDMESVLVSIRHELLDPEPHPARLDGSNKKNDYDISEAIEGYIRACNNHGWRVPAGFRVSVMAMQQPSQAGAPR